MGIQIVDCLEGKVVSCRQSRSPDAVLANSTLAAVICALRAGETPRVRARRRGASRSSSRNGAASSSSCGRPPARSRSRACRGPASTACASSRAARARSQERERELRRGEEPDLHVPLDAGRADSYRKVRLAPARLPVEHEVLGGRDEAEAHQVVLGVALREGDLGEV